MSSFTDEELIGRCFVGEGKPEALGRGQKAILGAAYMQGPTIIGKDDAHKRISATLMIGPLNNNDSPTPSAQISICGASASNPSLFVIGNTVVQANHFVTSDILAGGNITARGEVKSQCGGHILSSKKNFDIPHPSKEGYRLRHTCPEAPYNDVYIRGKVKNKTEIELPSYWKDFVDIQSITVSLTPIGAHQNVIVKRIDENKVYLQANGGIPINCFYHIFAERKDGEKLIPEYQGKGPQDYPGDNNEYSVSGYHYDVKENKE
jgi:hypothetical protein